MDIGQPEQYCPLQGVAEASGINEMVQEESVMNENGAQDRALRSIGWTG